MATTTERNWKLDPEEHWEDRGVEGGGGYRYLTVQNADATGGHEVARVWVDEDDGEMLADARLITAAPALLAVIEAAERRSIERQEMGGRGGVLDDDIFTRMTALIHGCR